MTPETKPCVRCRVPIHAASRECKLCGANQRAMSSTARRLIWAGVAVAIGGTAAVAVAVLGGSTGGGSALRLYESPAIVGEVPSGWTGGPVGPPAPGTAKVVFTDPLDSRRSVIITAERPAPQAALARARAARKVAHTSGGYRQHFFGHIRFPDGRPAWLLTYSVVDSYRAVYVFSACKPTYAMSVELRALSQADVRSSLSGIAPSAAPRC